MQSLLFLWYGFMVLLAHSWIDIPCPLYINTYGNILYYQQSLVQELFPFSVFLIYISLSIFHKFFSPLPIFSFAYFLHIFLSFCLFVSFSHHYYAAYFFLSFTYHIFILFSLSLPLPSYFLSHKQPFSLFIYMFIVFFIICELKRK